MITKPNFKVALAIAVLLPTSCAGTDVGNGFVDVDFALYDSAESAAAALNAAPAGLAVTNAWVAVERVRLRSAASCEGDSELELVGPFAIDMLAAGAPAALSDLEVSYVDYCRFELRWDELDDGSAPGAPDELVGASVLIEGTRGDGTPFVLRSERGDQLRLDARDGSFSIDEMTSALFVAFDAQTLFDEVDLDAAVVGGDGVIRIEDGANDDLLETFDDNLATAAKLFDDNDGDKELDPDERDETDVLAE